MIQGILKCISPERLSLLIENDWSVMESFFYGLYGPPPIDVYQKLDMKEVKRLETLRRNLARTVLPILGFARSVASRFPTELVEKKVTAEWLMEKGYKKFPELTSVIEKYGEKGRAWLDKQARQICDFLTGKIVYDPKSLRFISLQELKVEVEKHAKK